ncbi:hypothetical protein Cni_G26035 [Canna indica]|uniref:Uncharacterized protein n=1 Tax=Canna indica TaxID=4628 RepID=A0AAQ3L2Y1_9LILI|nr:hypothetical protein Cni_G26035 [Canna indica]
MCMTYIHPMIPDNKDDATERIPDQDAEHPAPEQNGPALKNGGSGMAGMKQGDLIIWYVEQQNAQDIGTNFTVVDEEIDSIPGKIGPTLFSPDIKTYTVIVETVSKAVKTANARLETVTVSTVVAVTL